jgi:hypothetical protein
MEESWDKIGDEQLSPHHEHGLFQCLVMGTWRRGNPDKHMNTKGGWLIVSSPPIVSHQLTLAENKHIKILTQKISREESNHH